MTAMGDDFKENTLGTLREAVEEGRLYDIGLSFINTREEDVKRIEQYIEKLLES